MARPDSDEAPEALTLADTDSEENWEKYRDRFVEGV
jgi:hypothetical protein